MQDSSFIQMLVSEVAALLNLVYHNILSTTDASMDMKAAVTAHCSECPLCPVHME